MYTHTYTHTHTHTHTHTQQPIVAGETVTAVNGGSTTSGEGTFFEGVKKDGPALPATATGTIGEVSGREHIYLHTYTHNDTDIPHHL